MTDTSISRQPRPPGPNGNHETVADAETADKGKAVSSTTLGGLFRSWLKTSLKGRSDANWRDTIEDLIDDTNEPDTAIPAAERDLIGNILRLRELTAYDVMIPRADIVAVEISATMEELLHALARHPHSRLPVYRESLDDVVGIVHIKDVLAQTAESHPFQLDQIMRDVLIVAPSITVLELLFEMRESRQHLALVVDEFGGIDGLVTIEDLVEEIVGDIADEHDINETPEMKEMSDGSWAVDARVPLEVLAETFGPLVAPDEEEDIDTAGGLVFSLAGRIPGRGELLRHDRSGLEFEIVDADPRRIRRLVVRHKPGPDGYANGDAGDKEAGDGGVAHPATVQSHWSPPSADRAESGREGSIPADRPE